MKKTKNRRKRYWMDLGGGIGAWMVETRRKTLRYSPSTKLPDLHSVRRNV